MISHIEEIVAPDHNTPVTSSAPFLSIPIIPLVPFYLSPMLSVLMSVTIKHEHGRAIGGVNAIGAHVKHPVELCGVQDRFWLPLDDEAAGAEQHQVCRIARRSVDVVDGESNRLPSRASCWHKSNTSRACAMSRFAVGSSNNSTSACVARLRAMMTRWRSPLDNSSTGRWRCTDPHGAGAA